MRGRRVTVALALLLLSAAAAGCGAATRRVVTVPSRGMLPTIKPGGRAAVDLAAYVGRTPARFDIGVFQASEGNTPEGGEPPRGDDAFYVQRVVGLGGETVSLRGGRVFVNGRLLEEPFATLPPDAAAEFGPVAVPAGEFFLLGDNRPDSEDGRVWRRPTVREGQIVGQVVEIIQE